MISTDIIFLQQEKLVENQKCQAGFKLDSGWIQAPMQQNTKFQIIQEIDGKKSATINPSFDSMIKYFSQIGMA